MPVRIPITRLYALPLRRGFAAKLTTRQPDDSQIEVAIASLKAVVPPEDLAQEPETCPEEKLVGEPNAG